MEAVRNFQPLTLDLFIVYDDILCCQVKKAVKKKWRRYRSQRIDRRRLSNRPLSYYSRRMSSRSTEQVFIIPYVNILSRSFFDLSMCVIPTADGPYRALSAFMAFRPFLKQA